MGFSQTNNAFTFTPAQACDSAQVTFTPLLNSPLPQVTQWTWDFGGGNTYSGQTPPPVNFTTPGIYPVTCTTSVYNMVLQSLNISVGGQGWWCGDIEELNCGNGNADIVPTFTTGANSWTGLEVADNPNPSWSGINYTLTGISYSISLEEIDAISQNDHPAGPYSGTVTGPGTYTFNYPGNFSGSFTIGLSLASQVIVTDTVIIYASPSPDTIDVNNSTLCPGELATLSVYPGMVYEWMLNDTLVVQSGNANTYTTANLGNYKVKIIDTISGCYYITDAVTLTSLTGIPSSFSSTGILLSGGVLTTTLTSGYTFQWLYYDGLNYSQIPPPEGTASSYTPQFNGVYCLVATNVFGCSDTSNCITLALGMDDPFAGNQVNLYPNPAASEVNLFIQELHTDATLTLYNTLGAAVHTEFIANPDGSLTHTVQLGDLPAGIYLAEIGAGNYRKVLRLVKQ